MLLGRRSLTCLILLVCSLALAAPAHTAYADLDQEEEDPDAPLPWQVGPKQILLGHHIELALPSGYQFLGLPHAETVMMQLGNLNNDSLLGIVISSEPTAEPIEDDGFLISLRYEAEGYVRDDEVLDGKAILQAFHEAETTYNDDRKKAGFPAIHAEGWQEPPHYDKARHQILWGLLLSSPDDEAGADRTVNFNTRVLGRKGFVSINLVTDARMLPKYKPAAAAILDATKFTQGMRYEDFDATTDAVAEYGLTGLVLGGIGLGVAKLAKIGLLAKFGSLLLAGLIAGKKVLAMFFVVLAAGLRKLWNRRKDRVSQA